jgi:hypothetical protein
MDLVKYGCNLSESNKAGSSLTVEAFSDAQGTTTPVAVTAGDLVLEAFIDAVSSTVKGTIWLVNDGTAWQNLTPTGPVPGTLVAVTGPEVQYQQGSLVVFLEGNTFATANLNVTIAVVDAAIGAL